MEADGDWSTRQDGAHPMWVATFKTRMTQKGVIGYTDEQNLKQPAKSKNFPLLNINSSRFKALIATNERIKLNCKHWLAMKYDKKFCSDIVINQLEVNYHKWKIKQVPVTRLPKLGSAGIENVLCIGAAVIGTGFLSDNTGISTMTRLFGPC